MKIFRLILVSILNLAVASVSHAFSYSQPGGALAPTAICQNITVQLDAAGNSTISAADVDGGSTGTGMLNLEVTPSSFNCSMIGNNNTVTLTVTDDNGSAACTATVTVEYVTPPVITCQNITVELRADGQFDMADPTPVITSASDNCGLGGNTVSGPRFLNCSNLGTPVSYGFNMFDQAGNKTTCNVMVSVADNLTPTARCQDITVYLDASGNNVPEFEINTESVDLSRGIGKNRGRLWKSALHLQNDLFSVTSSWVFITPSIPWTLDASPFSAKPYFRVDYRTASLDATGALELQLIDEQGNATLLHAPSFAPTGDWQNWATASENVQLTAGRHKMRVAITQTPFNMNWFEFSLLANSTKEPGQLEQVSVFPNPNTGLFSLEASLKEKQDIDIEIYNLLGQPIWKESLKGLTDLRRTIDLRSFPNGSYLLGIRMENGAVYSKRIVKTTHQK